ncbi:MAG TPA: sigma-70 family RNA polymerase sigma factor [Planctomycetaceae bacterium]|nr:sigma-70 family RNA polymerase sigma factor [Planctomycetaceae bacterium]
MPDPTDDLLREAAAGDADAVNRLLERHREPLRRAVSLRLDRKLARRVDASDVVQDVLLEASRRLPEFLREAKMPFRIWLRQLARDRIIDMHRRHRAAGRRSIDREQPLAGAGFGDRSSFDLAAQLVDPELTPAAASIRRELHRRFLAALDELSEEDREVILLRHVDHLGNGEVAQALGLTPPAAGMRYLRALRRLRAVLGEPP